MTVKDPKGSILRHAACCLLGLGLSALAAGAAPLPPSGFDRPPLLAIHWETDTIAGQHIDTMVVIHAGGAASRRVPGRRAGPHPARQPHAC